MFLSYFEPVYLRGRSDLYIPYFYKQLQDYGINDVIYITNEDYFEPIENWENRGCHNLSDFARDFHQFDFPNNEILYNAKKEIIPCKIFDQLLSENNNIEAEKILLTKVYNPLKDFFENLLCKLTKEYTIEGIFTVKNCPSLEKVAADYNIPVIHYEIAALRPYNYQFLAFFDYKGVNGNTSAKELYNEFKKSFIAKPVKLLSNTEILDLFKRNNFEPDNIDVSNPNFKIGLALQIFNDSNIIAFSKGFNSDTLINYFTEKFSIDDIIIRNHPSTTESKLLDFSNIDKSAQTNQFIKRCNCIATINSSVAFEAALFDKPVYIFGESPYEILSENEKTLNNIHKINVNSYERTLKINFLSFAYMVPYELLFDLNYVRYRLTNPNMIDLYLYHLNYYQENMLETKLHSLHSDTINLNLKLDNLFECNRNLSNQLNSLIERANQPTFLQKIFSIKNEENHKILRILGIKMKFRRNK